MKETHKLIRLDKNTNKVVLPTLTLRSKFGTKKYGNIPKYFNWNASIVGNGIDEISFDVHKYVDGVKCPVWDDLINLKTVQLDNHSRYEISVSYSDKEETIKTVNGQSLECELGQIMLYEMHINDEDAMSGNITEYNKVHFDNDGNFIPTVFCNFEDKNNSLLHRLLADKAPHWTIGSVPQYIVLDEEGYEPELSTSFQRTYTFDGKSIYDALMEIAQESNVVFIFDTMTRTINCYNLTDGYDKDGNKIVDAIGQDTSILISKDKLANEIGISSNKDEVKNCFRVEGGDDILTSYVAAANVNSTNYIYQFADFQYKDMSPTLAKKLKLYQQIINDSREPYWGEKGIYTLLCEKYKDLEYYKSSKMPNVSLPETTAEEQWNNIAKGFKSTPVYIVNRDSKYSSKYFTGITKTVENIAKIYGDYRYTYDLDEDTVEYDDTTHEWKGLFTLTRTTDSKDYYPKTEEQKSNSIITVKIENDTEESQTYAQQSLKLALADNNLYDVDFKFTNYTDDEIREVFEQYSLERLKAFQNGYSACLNVLLKIGENQSSCIALHNESTTIDNNHPCYVIGAHGYIQITDVLNANKTTGYIFRGLGKNLNVSFAPTNSTHTLIQYDEGSNIINTDTWTGGDYHVTSKEFIFKDNCAFFEIQYSGTKCAGCSYRIADDDIRINISCDDYTNVNYSIDGGAYTPLNSNSQDFRLNGKLGFSLYTSNDSEIPIEYTIYRYGSGSVLYNSYFRRYKICTDVLNKRQAEIEQIQKEINVLTKDQETLQNTINFQYYLENVVESKIITSKNSGYPYWTTINKDTSGYEKSDPTLLTSIDITVLNRTCFCNKDEGLEEPDYSNRESIIDSSWYYRLRYRDDSVTSWMKIGDYCHIPKNNTPYSSIDIMASGYSSSSVVIVREIHDNNEEYYKEFASYRREDQYKNDNYISDYLSEYECLEKAQELLNRATIEIKKSCMLQRTVTSSLKNLFILPEFESLKSGFDIFNYIRVKSSDELMKLRITQIDWSGDSFDDISVTFSDKIESIDGLTSDTASILEQANSIASSYSSTQLQAKQGSKANNIVDEMYSTGLNSAKTMINSSNNEVIMDASGFLAKRMDEIGSYGEKQLRVLGNGIYMTTDNWETVNMAIGESTFINPNTLEQERTYGVIAEKIVGKLIAGNQMYISNTSGSVNITGDGITITNGSLDLYNEDTKIKVTIDPKNNLVNSDVFAIKKQNSDESWDTMLGVDSEGNATFSGNIVGSSGEFNKGFKVEVPIPSPSPHTAIFSIYGSDESISESLRNQVRFGRDDNYIVTYLDDTDASHKVNSIKIKSPLGSVARFENGDNAILDIGNKNIWIQNGSNLNFTCGGKIFGSYTSVATSRPPTDKAKTIIEGFNGSVTYFGSRGDEGGHYSANELTTAIRGDKISIYTHGTTGVHCDIELTPKNGDVKINGSAIQGSDETIKDIYELDERYEQFFLNLNPCLYQYKHFSDDSLYHRKHMGFGARQVSQALTDAGIDSEDFAGLVIQKDVILDDNYITTDEPIHLDEFYQLRYSEFISLNTYMIQKLMRRVDELEKTVNELKGEKGING